MRSIDELTNTEEPAITLIREWVDQSPHSCYLLPPSSQRSSVLHALQVTTRSPLGALAYDTGGLLIQDGWLRLLGSGHPRISRDLASWNPDTSRGYVLVADDVLGGFFALNGGALGPDLHAVHYWAPDDVEWLSLKLTFTEFLQSTLSPQLDDFYASLRWPSWRADIATVSGDQCFAFYPFLWSREGSLTASSRAVVPVSEALTLKNEVLQQLGSGA